MTSAAGHRVHVPDGAVRASLGVGSSSADVDRLLEALDTVPTIFGVAELRGAS